MHEDPLKCSVCQARFRGAWACPRCGADLEPLMSLAAEAFARRRAARQALRQGRFKAAEALAAESQTVCLTRSGRDLILLSLWLGLGEPR